MKDKKFLFHTGTGRNPCFFSDPARRDTGNRRLSARFMRYRDATPGDTATNYDVGGKNRTFRDHRVQIPGKTAQPPRQTPDFSGKRDTTRHVTLSL